MYFKEWEDNAKTFFKAKYEREMEEARRKDEKKNEENEEGRGKQSQEAEKKKREKREKEKMRRDIEKSQIAKETRCGINFTGKEHLTEHLNQDPLEAFLGCHRMMCGQNDNPNVNMFMQNTVSLRIQGSAALKPFRGNCRRRKRSEIQPISVDTVLARY